MSANNEVDKRFWEAANQLVNSHAVPKAQGVWADLTIRLLNLTIRLLKISPLPTDNPTEG